MTKNPHKQARLDAEAAISYIKESLGQAEANLRWLSNFNLVSVEDRLAALRHSLQKTRRAADMATSARILLEKSLVELGSASKVGLNPLRLLSTKRSVAKRAHDAKRAELAAFVAANEAVWQEVELVETQIGALELDLARFHSLNVVAEERTLAQASATLADAQARLNLAVRIDNGTAELYGELTDKTRALNECVEGIRVARGYERALEGKDAYQSRLIFDACRERFGRSGRETPRQIIMELDRKRIQLERDVAKLEVRIRDLARRLAIQPRRIVIDGSNMCYREKDLIGIEALVATAAMITKSLQCEVKVVFDQSTIHRLRMSFSTIKRRFGDATEVIESSRGQPADEQILWLAEGEGGYVLSNDRFVDFPDRAAVRSKRVIGHSISDEMVYVADLRLKVYY